MSLSGKIVGLITGTLERLGITSGGTYSPGGATVTATTAVVVGAATTSGVRLDLESGQLAVRDGDDSGYENLFARGIFSSGGDGFSNPVGSYSLGNAASPTLDLRDTGTIRWTNNSLWTGTKDVGLARASAGIVKVTDGSSGAGRLQVADGDTTTPTIHGTTSTNAGLAFTTNTMYLIGGGATHGSLNGAGLNFFTALNGTGVPLSGNTLVVTNSTGDASLNNGANTSTVRTNAGAAGEVILSLPTAVAGLPYYFVVEAAQYLRVKAATGDVIRGTRSANVVAGTIESSATGGYWRSNVPGAHIRIVAIDSTTWQIVSIGGTWTIDS